MKTFNREEYLKEAEYYIPWGSSTCSKAASFHPYDPAAIVRGKGCRVWDIEGREFIDFRNGLGPVTLGYAYDEVNDAVKEQLEKGVVYGNPSVLELELAKVVCDVIPCAEMVRFLKTGGEAIAAAIRLARAYTGRDHVIQVGYNGWLNTLASKCAPLPGGMGTSAGSGVPEALGSLHHSAPYGNVEAMKALVEQYSGNVAAIVVAAAYTDAEIGKTYYPALRKICDDNGIVLIYDEIVTGFRVALAGVQELYGVTPDLAVFSKGMANGMPLSVFCGKRDIMKLCAKGGGCVISSTFSGDALALAASLATINIYRRDNVIGHLYKMGRKLKDGANKLFGEYNIPIEAVGFDCFPSFAAKSGAPAGIVNDMLMECYKNGISFYHVAYVNFSHKESDIDEVLAKLKLVCEAIKK